MNGRLATWGLLLAGFTGVVQWVEPALAPLHVASAIWCVIWMVAHMADRGNSPGGWLAGATLVALAATGYAPGGILHVAAALLASGAFVLHGKTRLDWRHGLLAEAWIFGTAGLLVLAQ